jgi:RNA polymerase sigma-70 factor (ECF subfamily)
MHTRAAAVDETEAGSSEAEPAISFDVFYSALFVPLFRSMLLLNGNAAEAEDVTQEAFVRVLERWESVSRMEAPNAYLFRTALNLERNRLRRAWRRSRRVPEERDVKQDFSQEAVERADVLRVLRGLSREQREAIVLMDFLGMTSEEAGRVASVSAEALRARLHRARAAMRKELIADE